MYDAATLLDAVETLSTIVESEIGVGVMDDHLISLRGKSVQYRTVHWISAKGGKDAIDHIRQIFNVIFEYIQEREKDVEGVRTLMQLVGQATRKLYLAGLIGVRDSNEYRQIQDFYNKQIAPKIDRDKLGVWMLAFTKNAMQAKKALRLKGKEKKPVLVDLEAVKSDREYELFFLKKEDGTRFYNPRLLQNIRLVCHFEAQFSGKEEDPFVQVEEWLMHVHQNVAKSILGSISTALNRFYRLSVKKGDNELVADLKKCVMALMLAAQPGAKGKKCKQYFADFQRYYREILYSPEYYKLINEPLSEKDHLGKGMLDLIQKIASAIYREISLYKFLFPQVNQFIEASLASPPSEEGPVSLWNGLSSDYLALQKHTKGHLTGSLERLLGDLKGKGNPTYDPWMQQNYPSQLYRIQIGDRTAECLHIPCPVIQEFIHKAVVNEEFKNFIRGGDELEPHLIFNLQDRTSWKEHARCAALEDLQHIKQFENRLHVVTFAKTTDFYHQEANYAKVQHADLFKSTLKEHLNDLNTGFYFPPTSALTTWENLEPMIEAIHNIFFSGKNVLSRDQRLDFIEIVYLALQMHLLGKFQPSSFSFICKDGVDGGAAGAATFLAAVKLFSPTKLTTEDRKIINEIMHTSALLNRERIVHPHIFKRFLSAIRTIEGVREREGPTLADKLSKFIELPVFLT